MTRAAGAAKRFDRAGGWCEQGSVAYDFSGTCKSIKEPGKFGLPENDVCIMGESYDFRTDVEVEKHDCWASPTNLADPKAGGIGLGTVR